VIEDRLERAQEHTLINQDEALLTLLEYGIGEYLEQPVPDLLNALHSEIEDPDSPSLWETYNAATRALTHYSGDVPDYELDRGFERAARLLETGTNELPDPDALGRQVVEDRVNRFIEREDTEEYWEGEQESLRELLESHEVEA